MKKIVRISLDEEIYNALQSEAEKYHLRRISSYLKLLAHWKYYTLRENENENSQSKLA